MSRRPQQRSEVLKFRWKFVNSTPSPIPGLRSLEPMLHGAKFSPRCLPRWRSKGCNSKFYDPPHKNEPIRIRPLALLHTELSFDSSVSPHLRCIIGHRLKLPWFPEYAGAPTTSPQSTYLRRHEQRRIRMRQSQVATGQFDT